jgi:hypothetical protein
MFDYHSCGVHLGIVWYDAKPCPECFKEHMAALDKAYGQGYYAGNMHRQLNPGKPLTQHQIDRLE